MPIKIITFANGVEMPEEIIDDAAERIVKSVMSELPEEIQTYEGANYALKIVKKKLKTMKIIS